MKIEKILPVLLLWAGAAPVPTDARAGYDVQAYRLDLVVDPDRQSLAGFVHMEAIVSTAKLERIEMDVAAQLDVEATYLAVGALQEQGLAPELGRKAKFTHARDRLRVAASLKRGDRFVLSVRYAGSPRALNGFDGFHWNQSADGRAWVSTSSQSTGSRYWWPSKDSYFHPEDKPERVYVNLCVPAGLEGVSNGRLVGREAIESFCGIELQGAWELFRWHHPYPLETYSVTLNVAPYVVVDKELELDGIEEPVPFVYYVLPENAEKAALQFAQVPRMLEVFSEAFGPFPFPKSKFSLVETSFWGMEHSSAIAYGSSYPAWCEREGKPDRHASRNRFFDYILIHESAHEWWGNAVSASSWGHFWIHEGFGTYAEGVYLEWLEGRERADAYFRSIRGSVPPRGSLYRGDDVDSGQAYSALIYYKGASVLETLRHYLDDDETWWRTLRNFNLAFRYKNAVTEDFRAQLEEESGRSWEIFFQEWFYGSGYPELSGKVKVAARTIRIDIENEGSDGTDFHVPLDLVWIEAGEQVRRRVMLDPGDNRVTIRRQSKPSQVEIVKLERVLGRHRVSVD